MILPRSADTGVAGGAGAALSSSREIEGEVVALDEAMGDSALVSVRIPESVVRGLRPGRFFQILCRYGEAVDPLLRRPYSVFATDPDAGVVTFLVRPFGRGSGWLAGRRLGDAISLLGPLGNSYTVEGTSRNLLMVAGGVGVAPLVMLARAEVERGRSVTFLLGAACEAGLLAPYHLPSAVEYVVATDDGSKGHAGFVTELVPDYVRWADQIFACGPEPMYRSLRQAVVPRRIGKRPPVQVSVEREMACGLGVCLGCVVETKRGMQTSCVQGPVFDMDDVLW